MSDRDKIEKYENEWLNPTEEEQLKLILEGKCPHNRGWRYEGHGHTVMPIHVCYVDF